MKILVIGGNGFLGGAIARCLSVAGHEISVVSRTVPTTKSFSFYSIDLFEVQEVRELIKVVKPDVVIQSAWITGKSDYRNSPLNPRYHGFISGSSTVLITSYATSKSGTESICFVDFLKKYFY